MNPKQLIILSNEKSCGLIKGILQRQKRENIIFYCKMMEI